MRTNKWTIAMVLCLGIMVGVGLLTGASFAKSQKKIAQQPMVLVFDTKKIK